MPEQYQLFSPLREPEYAALRADIAKHVMAGFAARSSYGAPGAARDAVLWADALIAEMEKPQP